MRKKLSPQLNILISFLVLIIIGTLLLMFPFSMKEQTSFFNNLFTATSAVTITGLTTVDLYSTYSIFGKIVIALLIQLGGLSITTLTLFILTIIGAKIGYGSRDLMKENISAENQIGVVKMVKKIVLLTFVIEFIGAFIFTIIFIKAGDSFFNALGKGLFHAISSYNNAGLTIFSGENSLMNFSNNNLFIITTSILIILGGLGTIVIFDIVNNKRWRKLKAHSKIVLKMTFTLLVIGFITFYVFEDGVNIVNAFFHTTTLRTAGFYSYDYSSIKAITILTMVVLMFIGGGPASTSGGVKVTSVYTLYKLLGNTITHKPALVNKRKISNEQIKKATTTIFLTFLFTLIGVAILSMLNTSISLDKIVIEVVSAISNTGLSLNLTTSLTKVSQIILIFLMILGRVTVITFIYAFIFKKQSDGVEIDYLEVSYLV